MIRFKRNIILVSIALILGFFSFYRLVHDKQELMKISQVSNLSDGEFRPNSDNDIADLLMDINKESILSSVILDISLFETICVGKDFDRKMGLVSSILPVRISCLSSRIDRFVSLHFVDSESNIRILINRIQV